MADVSNHTTRIQRCLDRMGQGDVAARNELLDAACGRLQRLTRKMLKGSPRVKRWEQTEDVFQNATVRLCRALNKVTPKSVLDFINLAAEQIRRELTDLARHYRVRAAKHQSNAKKSNAKKRGSKSGDTPAYEIASGSHNPEKLEAWSAFHEAINDLPDEEREVADLLYYQGLPQAEAAALLLVTVRTVKAKIVQRPGWPPAQMMHFITRRCATDA